jgi:hypothetical protein
MTEGVCKRLAIRPPLHMRRLDFFRKSFWFQTLKARRLLGFDASIPFEAGVRDALAWYADAGYLTYRQQRAHVFTRNKKASRPAPTHSSA